jgi:aspartate kinase
MAVVVQKYGGSSVADVERLGRVADKVVAAKQTGHDVVVVVSAMGKTTDELLSLAKRVAPDPPRRELDMLVSTGERVSMALLSIAIHARGGDSISFTGSQSGIITTDRHFDARIVEVKPRRIEDELARGKIVIVAGYQGMSTKREITTLGRGGSDTTAVALAAALGAERCEIYSDVDGVYSADPRVVPDAVHLPEIDLASLQEMAEAGAKVLNAQAVEWARRAKITLHARKTSDPLDAAGKPPRETISADGDGTSAAPLRRGQIDDDGAPVSRVRAVVGMDRIVLLRAPSVVFRALATAAAEVGMPMLDVALGPTEACACVPLLNVPDWEARRGKLLGLMAGAGSKVGFEDGYAMASVVGDGLTSGGSLPRFLDVLAPVLDGGMPERVTAGPLRLSAVFPAAKLSEAQRALHSALVV